MVIVRRILITRIYEGQGFRPHGARASARACASRRPGVACSRIPGAPIDIISRRGAVRADAKRVGRVRNRPRSAAMIRRATHRRLYRCAMCHRARAPLRVSQAIRRRHGDTCSWQASTALRIGRSHDSRPAKRSRSSAAAGSRESPRCCSCAAGLLRRRRRRGSLVRSSAIRPLATRACDAIYFAAARVAAGVWRAADPRAAPPISSTAASRCVSRVRRELSGGSTVVARAATP